MNIIVSSKRAVPVAIGLPVFNGENSIRRSIESHLNQDFSDFKLIISDNASSDSTQEICNEYLKEDKRITYVRNERNIGSGNNYTQTVNLAEDSKYFMWATHDDYRDPTFISKTIKELEKNQNATLCCTHVNFIDINDEPLDHLKESNMALGTDNSNMNIFEKYSDLVSKSCWCIIYGLFKYNALKSVMPFPNIHSGDLVLLFNFLLTGDIIRVPEPLFYFTYRNKTTKDYIDDMETTGRINYEKKVFSFATREIIKNIYDSQLSLKEKVKVQKVFIKAIKDSPYWGKVLENENSDISVLQESVLRGIIYRDDVIYNLLNKKEYIINSIKEVKKTDYQFNDEIEKLKNLVNKNEFSLAFFVREGLLKHFGERFELVIIEVLLAHRNQNFDNAIITLDKSIDYLISSKELEEILELSGKNNYFVFIVDKLSKFIEDNNDLTTYTSSLAYIKNLINLESINRLEKIYNLFINNQEINNYIKNFFLKRALKVSFLNNYTPIKHAVSFIIRSNNNIHNLLNYLNSELENIEIIVLTDLEILVEPTNNNNIIVMKNNNILYDIKTVIQMASGKYINIIKDNEEFRDILNKERLDKIANLDENIMAYCIFKDKNTIKIDEKLLKDFILKDFYPSDESIFFNKRAFEIYGDFNFSYNGLFEYEFLLRLSQSHLIKFDNSSSTDKRINSDNLNFSVNTIKNQYLEAFKESKLINKPYFSEIKDINFNGIDFLIHYKFEENINIKGNIYIILFSKITFENLEVTDINKINYSYDQIWVTSQNEHQSYIEYGIEESKLRIIPNNYSIKSYNKLASYINELKYSPVIRHNIGQIKIDLKKNAFDNFKNQKYDYSEVEFKKLLSYNSFSTEILYYLGLSQFKQGKYEEAIDSLYSCVELNFYNKELFEIISLAFDKIGDFDSSNEFLEKSKEL